MKQQQEGKIIKVVGIGSGGSNAVSHMVEMNVKGIEFIAVDTDILHLEQCKADIKIPVGFKALGGFSAAGDVELGQRSAGENREDIANAVYGADMVFIIAGLGGGTGTGGFPVVAEIARKTGALTIGVITKPFPFEPIRKMNIAIEMMKKLTERVDTLITFSNSRLLEIIYKETPSLQILKVEEAIKVKKLISSAFLSVVLRTDDILRQAVQGISDLFLMPGELNLNLSDFKNLMSNNSYSVDYMSIGTGNTAIEAAIHSITSPLLEGKVKHSIRILANITGKNLTTSDINTVYEFLEAAGNKCTVIIGTALDETMDDIKITVFVSTHGRLL